MAGKKPPREYETMLFIGGPLDGSRLQPAGWMHRLVMRKQVTTQSYFANKPICEPPDDLMYWTYVLREWAGGVRFMAEESMTAEQILKALISKYPTDDPKG